MIYEFKAAIDGIEWDETPIIDYLETADLPDAGSAHPLTTARNHAERLTQIYGAEIRYNLQGSGQGYYARLTKEILPVFEMKYPEPSSTVERSFTMGFKKEEVGFFKTVLDANQIPYTEQTGLVPPKKEGDQFSLIIFLEMPLRPGLRLIDYLDFYNTAIQMKVNFESTKL